MSAFDRGDPKIENLPALVFTLRVLVLADKYVTKYLSNAATNNFEKGCQRHWNMGSFANAAELAFRLDIASADEIHRFVTSIISKTVKALSKQNASTKNCSRVAPLRAALRSSLAKIEGQIPAGTEKLLCPQRCGWKCTASTAVLTDALAAMTHLDRHQSYPLHQCKRGRSSEVVIPRRIRRVDYLSRRLVVCASLGAERSQQRP